MFAAAIARKYQNGVSKVVLKPKYSVHSGERRIDSKKKKKKKLRTSDTGRRLGTGLPRLFKSWLHRQFIPVYISDVPRLDF